MSFLPFGADTLVIPLVLEGESLPGAGVVRPQGGMARLARAGARLLGGGAPVADERAADEAVPE